MKKIILKVRKKECKDTCPIPLEMIPNIEKAIQKIEYDEQSEKAEILYDETIISREKIVKKLKEIGYEVRK